MAASLPENEDARLKALDEYAILDTLPEKAYDDITRLASHIVGTPIALITLVDRDRQWFKSKIGLEVSQTPREQAFCAHAILNPTDVMVVTDARDDERFSANPLVTGEPYIRFYAGAPLNTPTGEALGTLCVIDRVPRQLQPNQIEMLEVLARDIVTQLELRRSFRSLNQANEEIEAKNRIMAREIEMAVQLQNALLPERFPSIECLKLSVAYNPVSGAGGDFYDVIRFSDSIVGFVQVDVSGHGVAAAMIGAMFKMAFQSFARAVPSPAGLLATINDQLFRLLPDSEFLTAFYAVMDTESLDLVYCNGGHPAPLLYRKQTHQIEELSTGGPLVGAFPEMVYEEGTVKLNRGDALLVYTDGITEAQGGNSPYEFYGEGRLRHVFLEGLVRMEVLPNIMEDLCRFRDASSFDDDVTLLLASVT